MPREKDGEGGRGGREAGGTEAGNHTREAGRQVGEAKREGQERESQEGREIGRQIKAEGGRARTDAGEGARHTLSR